MEKLQTLLNDTLHAHLSKTPVTGSGGIRHEKLNRAFQHAAWLNKKTRSVTPSKVPPSNSLTYKKYKNCVKSNNSIFFTSLFFVFYLL